MNHEIGHVDFTHEEALQEIGLYVMIVRHMQGRLTIAHTRITDLEKQLAEAMKARPADASYTAIVNGSEPITVTDVKVDPLPPQTGPWMNAKTAIAGGAKAHAPGWECRLMPNGAGAAGRL